MSIPEVEFESRGIERDSSLFTSFSETDITCCEIVDPSFSTFIIYLYIFLGASPCVP